MAVNEFDSIAPIYDQLARSVFGDSLLKAQVHFLSYIQPSDKVLIIGGGTGQLLEHLPPCSKVDYVEKSKKMLRRASKRKCGSEISYHAVDFLDFKSETIYDFVICPFFLDCFKKDQLEELLRKIKSLLVMKGSLVVTDFRKTKRNSFQLKLMHIFFRLTVRLEASKLLDLHAIVTSFRFEPINEIFLHRNQLFSRLYRNL